MQPHLLEKDRAAELILAHKLLGQEMDVIRTSFCDRSATFER